MDLYNLMQGSFPKTIDKSKPIFSSLIANKQNDAALQKQIYDLMKYMKEWISTPDIYKQSGTMLDMSVRFFSFIEQFTDETETSLKNRVRAIFVRNHDERWGTVFDVKNVFRQYFPSAVLYLVENTNKIDATEPSLANFLLDGDISTLTPDGWTFTDCIVSAAARFSKTYGVEMNQEDGYFQQTVTIPNRKRINDTEPYEYEPYSYFLHFFMSGKINVQIYSSANSKYWDYENKEWKSSPVDNIFEKAEWENCSLYFITDGNVDTADITVKFKYVNTPVITEFENTVVKGVCPVTWALENCVQDEEVINLVQSDSTVSTTASVIENQNYKLSFTHKGEISVIIKNNNDEYWDNNSKQWYDTQIVNIFQGRNWSNKTIDFETNEDSSSVDISFNYVVPTPVRPNPCSLENVVFEGALPITRTVTDCTISNKTVTLNQMSSLLSYTATVEPGNKYNFLSQYKGRTAVVIKNDNNEYWSFNTRSWENSEVVNMFLSEKLNEKDLEVIANSNTNEITYTFSIPNSYLDYFRLFQKQPYGSFTVIVHFDGNTSGNVWGLAAGDSDPNIETESETPPQPRYGNYGYYDSAYLSGVPIGFAKDLYEDLLDYLRAQGVRAYIDIVIKDYAE